MFSYILIPGRHHVLTNFMHDYFEDIGLSRRATLLDGSEAECAEDVQFIWAVTSANHANTRRNPLPGFRREAALERFTEDLSVQSQTYHIAHIGMSDRFADHLIKSIEVESRGTVLLTPENCIVATSNPAVIESFEKLGYQVAPIELESMQPEEYRALRAWDLALAMVEAGNKWQEDPVYQEYVHSSSKAILERYGLGDQIVELHQDPIVGNEGDITATRDYESYRAAFDQGAERKYTELAPYVVPGRILDIGCATGSLIKQLDNDPRLTESDFYGIEVARPLYNYCIQRLENGEFNNENTFFYQRNIMRGKLFPDNTVNTSITISLTHEIDSYLGRDALELFVHQIYEQTAPGGVYLNLDVTCPEQPDEQVLLWLNHEDGIDDAGTDYSADQQETYTPYLDSLSTLGRFKRFMRDFRTVEGDGLRDVDVFERDGKWYARLRLADAVEFMATKDYTKSWLSEMHERFCYWPPSEWKQKLESVGFTLDAASGAHQNPWINEHRFEGKVGLFQEVDGNMTQLPWPNMSVLLVARKV